MTPIVLSEIGGPSGPPGPFSLRAFAGRPWAGCRLPSCATLLSNAADPKEQGRAMGNNQAIQVGAEALSGLAAGLLAALIVKLPLIVLGAISILAGLLVAVLP